MSPKSGGRANGIYATSNKTEERIASKTYRTGKQIKDKENMQQGAIAVPSVVRLPMERALNEKK